MRRIILVGAVVVGLAAALLGPLLGAGLALLMLIRGDAGLNAAVALTLGLALALIGLALGLPLAWASWRSLQGYPATAWRLPAWGWFFAAFALSLVLGQIALSAGLVLVAPIFHVLAGALPALLIVSLVTHRGAELPPRQQIGALSWGALASTGLAIMAETVLVILAAVVAAIWLSVTNPQLVESLQEMMLNLQSGLDPQMLDPVAEALRSPLIIASVLGGIAIVVPIIEEAVKGLVVPIVLATGAVITRRQAFLLGVVSGAGFALLEGILNGVMALMSPASWGGVMLVRGGTAAIHSVATGFVALGWYAILIEKRWGRGLVYGALGVAVHGMWNLAAGGQAVTSFLAQDAASPAQGLATAGAAALMLGVWAFAVLVLVIGARRSAPSTLAATPPVDDT